MTTQRNTNNRRQIFISYSHEPPENAAFVRDLAGRLTMAGFAVWLDEEQMPGAAHIKQTLQKAIEESEIGLFIVTRRWIERDWTQFEVELLAARDGNRLLAVLREEVKFGDLGPHLLNLKNVRWRPQDEEHDARFWEIYCGVNDLPPGPKKDWGQRAIEIMPGSLAHADAVSIVSEKTERQAVNSDSLKLVQRERVALPCAGKPVTSVVGERWSFIATDQEEWVGIARDGALHPALPRLSEHSTAAFNSSGELLVATFEPMVARLRGPRWEYLPQEAAISCFTASPEGIIGGNVAGSLVAIDGGFSLPAIRIRDPIVGLTWFEGGLIVLGSRGRFGSLSWPITKNAELRWLNTDALGRPVGLFRAVEYNHIGLYSSTHVGVLDPSSGELEVCERVIEQGIREVVFLGARSRPYAVITDRGRLLLVDAGLGNARPVRLPHDAFVLGCVRQERAGDFLVWTRDGELYAISDQGGVEQVAGDNVVLAYCPDPTLDDLHVVRWQTETGATIESLSLN